MLARESLRGGDGQSGPNSFQQEMARQGQDATLGLEEGVPDVVEVGRQLPGMHPLLNNQNSVFIVLFWGPDVPGQREVRASLGRENENARESFYKFLFVWSKSLNPS